MPRPLRIAHVNDIAFVAGTLVDALLALGQDAELIGLPKTGARLPWPWKAASLPVRFGQLAWTAARLWGRFDVVHVHYASQGAVGILSRLPFVLHCHGSDVRFVEPRSVWALGLEILMRRASRVYYATPDLDEWVRPLRPDSAYLPNPVDVRRFTPGHAPERDVLVGVRLDQIKGSDTVVDILDQVVRLRPGTSVTIVAKGRDVRRAIAAGGAHTTVIEPVRHEDMPALLRRHRLVLGQTAVGALGQYELESMSCGLPVVASFRYPGAYRTPPPIVDFTATRDTAEVVCGLLDHPAEARDLGKRAAEWVAREHGMEPIARRLMAEYSAIARPVTKRPRPG